LVGVTAQSACQSKPACRFRIARDIRDGTVKKYLIQPIDMVGFPMLTRLAHKLVYCVVALGPFALVFCLCRGASRDAPRGQRSSRRS
jgi:ABC-2 type transport system permease protein